jgi:hypothetical protein
VTPAASDALREPCSAPLKNVCTLPAKDVFLMGHFRTFVCKCNDCIALYAAAGLSFITNTTASELENQCEQILRNDSPSLDTATVLPVRGELASMAQSALSRLPEARMVEISSKMNDFVNRIKQGLKEHMDQQLAQQGHLSVVDKSVIQNILARTKK